MRTILGCVTMFAMTCGLAAADDQVDLSKLIGKWELTEAKKGQALTLEFAANKKISVTVGHPGEEVKIEGTYEVSEKTNKLSVALKVSDQDIKEALTIKRLTDDELVTEDSKGKTGTMKRKK
jgi:uncharacterized protein (TIGR03066 family)